MNIAEKLDTIIQHLGKKDGESKEEDPDEKKLKEVEKEITEILDLMDSGDTREAIDEQLTQLEKQMQQDESEKTPYLQVFHPVDGQSGKKLTMHRRNAHLLLYDSALKRKHLVKKYPADLNHILHVKMKQKIELVKKAHAKQNNKNNK
jgi:hypothetical protein